MNKVLKNEKKQDSFDLLIDSFFKLFSVINNAGLVSLSIYGKNIIFVTVSAILTLGLTTLTFFSFEFLANLKLIYFAILFCIVGYVFLILVSSFMYLAFFFVSLLGFNVPEYINWKEKQKLNKALKASGVTNEKGQVPHILSRRTDGDLSIVTLHTHGLSSKEISLKLHKTEAMLGKKIIDVCPNPFNYSQSILKIEESALSKHVKFRDFQNLAKNRLDYVVGKSATGIVIENISKAPNMAIFGATGGGKSNFFNSLICQQLLNTHYLQFYLFDFKNGIEFGDYKDLPFCKLITEHKHAVDYLEKISYELDRRYKNMRGKRTLEYKFHKKDTILICIDEASVLLNSSNNKGLSARCSEILAHIGKLGRACGIHIIIGTQKPAQCHIPTELTTNLNQRMVFRLNDRADVVNALGKGSVDELGATPGLGVFRKGADKVQVQTLRITDSDILDIVSKAKENPFYGPMINERTSSEPILQSEDLTIQDQTEENKEEWVNGDW